MCTLYIGAIGFGLHEPFIVFFLPLVIISITFFNSLNRGQTCDLAAGFLVAGFCTCSQSAPGGGGAWCLTYFSAQSFASVFKTQYQLEKEKEKKILFPLY